MEDAEEASHHAVITCAARPSMRPVSKPSLTDEERVAISRQLYVPIAEWETRLLCLNPGTEDMPLRASLYTAAITYAEGLGVAGFPQRLQYEALSYTWGEPKFTHPIMINEHLFTITANLHEALVHLRHESDIYKWLWVDALCINQYDLDEKARQIRHMLTIFRKAQEVVAWLGQSGPFTHRGIQFLESIEKAFQKHSKSHFGVTEDQVLGELPNLSQEWLLAGYKGIVDILARPWWPRAWVVQEIFAARHRSLHIGSMKLSWDNINAVQQCIRVFECCSESQILGVLPQDWKLELERLVRPMVYYQYLDDTNPDLPHDLLSLLLRSSHLQATDAKDHIYALAGLSDSLTYPQVEKFGSSIPKRIDINYGLTVTETFQRTMLWFIDRWQSLEPLYFLSPASLGPEKDRPGKYGGGCQDLLGLPSWVPDFRCISGGLLHFNNLHHHRTSPHPGAISWWSNRGGWTNQKSSSRLSLRGLLMADIVSTGAVQGALGSKLLLPQRIECRYSTALEEIITDDDLARAQQRSPLWSTKDVEEVERLDELYDNISLLHQARDPACEEDYWRVPATVSSGDVLVAFDGGIYPLVLRSRVQGGYELIGYAVPEAKWVSEVEGWNSPVVDCGRFWPRGSRRGGRMITLEQYFELSRSFIQSQVDNEYVSEFVIC